MKAKVNKISISLVQGNILSQTADAIIVVTDPNLTVSKAISTLAGNSIQDETKKIGWSDVGTAVITSAGQLENATKMIHAVAPRWGEGSERGKLASVVWECLRVAEDNQLASICMSAISTGSLGYPIESAANIMLTRIIDYTFEEVKHLRHVTICLTDEAEFKVFKEEFERQIHDMRHNGEGRVRV